MATAIVFVNAFKANALEGMNLGTDSYKVFLSDVAPNVSTMANYADVTEIASGNGYTTGGNACTVSSHGQTSGTYKLVLASPTAWTATGGAIAQFRYAWLYDTTTNNLVGYYDYGSEINLAVSSTFTLTLDASNGVLQAA